MFKKLCILEKLLLIVLLLTLTSCATTQKQPIVKIETIEKPEITNNLDNSLSDLTTQITNSITEDGKKKIAVIEFSDLDGNVTQFGKYLAEELITRLFRTKKFEVVERQLLNKIISEQKLSITGMIDENSAKELGRILGVDAIVSGTITDFGTDFIVNARLISTETGEVFGAASTKVIKDNYVKKLVGYTVADKKAIAIITERLEENVIDSFQSAVEINTQNKIKLDYLLYECKSSKMNVENKDKYLIIRDIGTYGDCIYVFWNGRIVIARKNKLVTLEDVDEFKNSFKSVLFHIAKVMADYKTDEIDDFWLHNFKIYAQEKNIYKRLLLEKYKTFKYIFEVPIIKIKQSQISVKSNFGGDGYIGPSSYEDYIIDGQLIINSKVERKGKWDISDITTLTYPGEHTISRSGVLKGRGTSRFMLLEFICEPNNEHFILRNKEGDFRLTEQISCLQISELKIP